jgi:hypothetical protein
MCGKRVLYFVALLVLANPAVAATFDFTGGSGEAPSIDFIDSGIKATLTGGGVVEGEANAVVTRNTDGAGVAETPPSNGNPFYDKNRQISSRSSSGTGDHRNFLTITFDTSVRLETLTLADFDQTDEFGLRVGGIGLAGVNAITQSDLSSNTVNLLSLFASSSLIGTEFTIITGDGYPYDSDSFLLSGLTATPSVVPLPATLPLFATGFAALVLARRKRVLNAERRLAR